MELLQKEAQSKSCGRIIILEQRVENMKTLYESADVLVHVSRAEGFGLTPLEAIANGLVTIAVDQVAPTDFLADDFSVLLRSSKETCTEFPCSEGNSFCVFKKADGSGRWDDCQELEGAPFWYTVTPEQFAQSLLDVQGRLSEHQFRTGWGTAQVCQHSRWSKIAKLVEAEVQRLFVPESFETHGETNLWDPQVYCQYDRYQPELLTLFRTERPRELNSCEICTMAQRSALRACQN